MSGLVQRVLPAIAETELPVAGGGVFPVRRVYSVGRNYLDHIREMKEADERDPPFFFQKPRDAVVPDGAQVPYPPFTTDFQFEVELVVALGRGGRNIPVGKALDHVWGYAVGIDLTRRDRQRDARDLQLPWEAGKSFDASAPCGPIARARERFPRSRGPDRRRRCSQLEWRRDQLRDLIRSAPARVPRRG